MLDELNVEQQEALGRGWSEFALRSVLPFRTGAIDLVAAGNLAPEKSGRPD